MAGACFQKKFRQNSETWTYMVQHEKIQTNSETMGLAVHRRFQWIVHVQLHR